MFFPPTSSFYDKEEHPVLYRAYKKVDHKQKKQPRESEIATNAGEGDHPEMCLYRVAVLSAGPHPHFAQVERKARGKPDGSRGTDERW